MIRLCSIGTGPKAFCGNVKKNLGAQDEPAVAAGTHAPTRKRCANSRRTTVILGVRRSRLWFLAIAFLLPLCLYAATAPKLTRHVTDLTGTLSEQQVNELDARLEEFEQAKGTQLVVLMVNSTGQEDIEAYSLAVAGANQIGRKGADDGILMLIAKSDQHVRIEVGYGLEGAIPDAAAARIIADDVIPRFRNDDYFGGISDAVGALVELANAEPLPPAKSTVSRGSPVVAAVLGLLAVLLLGLFSRRVYLKQRAKRGATTLSALLWTVFWVVAGILTLLLSFLFLLFKLRGRRHGGGLFKGGRGVFKGGGGRFGGGGASGNW